MTTSDRRPRRGFTLIEVVIVLAVLGLILGAAMPLVTTVMDQGRRTDVHDEFDALITALDTYYHDHGAFPARLDDRAFLGPYLMPGIDDTAIQDAWGSGTYVYARSANPDRATLTSVGINGRYENGLGDDLRVELDARIPGNRRTRARLRVIVQALANFMEGGGTLTGVWRTDARNMGLGPDYHGDGFGTDFRLDPATYEVTSAGADRRFGTSDDLGT